MATHASALTSTEIDDGWVIEGAPLPSKSVGVTADRPRSAIEQAYWTQVEYVVPLMDFGEPDPEVAAFWSCR